MLPVIILVMVGILGLLPFFANTYLLQTLSPESVLVYTAIVYSAAIFAFYIIHKEHVHNAFEKLSTKTVGVLVLAGILGVFIPNMIYVRIMRFHRDEIFSFFKVHMGTIITSIGIVFVVFGSVMMKKLAPK